MRAFQPNADIERLITLWLNEHEVSDVVAEMLISKFKEARLQLDEFSTIGNFFIHSGLFESFVQFVLLKLDDGSEIPWGHFIHALIRGAPEEIPHSLKQQIYLSAELQGRTDLLSQTTLFDEFRPEIEYHRNLKTKKAKEANSLRRKEIQEKLDIFRTQNLFEDEEKILNLLMLLEPDNRSLLDQKMDLRNRMAQEFLAKRTQRKHLLFPVDFIEKKPPEEVEVLQAIFNSMLSALQRFPQLAEDFAIALIIWEDYDHALEMIERIFAPVTRSWLRAECLLQSRRFVELLEILDSVEIYVSQDPDLLFAQNYLRAQAFWGLEKKNKAIELLEQIVEARPNYRSAQVLLTHWKENIVWLSE